MSNEEQERFLEFTRRDFLEALRKEGMDFFEGMNTETLLNIRDAVSDILEYRWELANRERGRESVGVVGGSLSIEG